MNNPSTLAGFGLTFLRILGSTVVGKHSAVLEGVEGGLGGLDDTSEDTPGEQGVDVESYGQLGVIARPRVPSTIENELVGAEGFGVRTPRGLVPLAKRDLRLNRRFPAPKPGTTALVGYGGGFLSFDDADGDTSLSTWYAPYARNAAGTPQKAHTITLDPTGEAINIVHGDGGQVVLLPNKQIMMLSDGSTWAKMAPGKFEVQAAQISLIGSVYVGTPTGAFPLVKFAEMAAAFDTHVHPTAMGPSGVPATPITPQVATIGTTRILGI